MAIDYTTDRGKIRALIPDVDEDNFVLTDALIDAYLAVSQDNVYIATALALEAIATDETLTYKVVRTDDLSVDGTSGAKLLLDRAKGYRAAAEQAEDAFQMVFPDQDPYGSATYPEASSRPWPYPLNRGILR